MENEVNLKVHQQQLLHYTTPPDGALISRSSLFFSFYLFFFSVLRKTIAGRTDRKLAQKQKSQGALVHVAAV